MIKTYVLDTNVLIQAPYAVNCFEENYIVLPMVVLEELDNLKKAEGERGANARASIRMLEQLRMRGDLLKGVTLENGGTLRVEKNYVDVELPPDLPEEKADNRILKVCRADRTAGRGGAGTGEAAPDYTCDQGYSAAHQGTNYRDTG